VNTEDRKNEAGEVRRKDETMSVEPIGNGDGQSPRRRRRSTPPRRRDGAPGSRRRPTAAVVVDRPPALDTSHVLVSGDAFVGRPLGGRKPQDLVEPTEVRLRLAHVGPLSVFTMTLLFGALAMAGLVAGLAVLYALLQATGVLHSVEKLVNTTGVGHQFHFNGGWIFTRVVWVTAGMVAIGSTIAACLTLLYNSLADLTGGLDVTFSEHPRTVLTADETPTWVTRFRGLRLSREERAASDGAEPVEREPRAG
jgi:hypothetical protein